MQGVRTASTSRLSHAAEEADPQGPGAAPFAWLAGCAADNQRFPVDGRMVVLSVVPPQRKSLKPRPVHAPHGQAGDQGGTPLARERPTAETPGCSLAAFILASAA